MDRKERYKTQFFTKAQAIGLMEKGEKITHVHFSRDEWMTMKDGKIVLEDSVVCEPSEFWQWRTASSWEHDYFIFKTN